MTTSKYISALVLAFCILTISFTKSMAQVNPSPGASQTEAILLMGGTAHLGDGRVVNNCAIGFKEGKFTLIGDATLIRIDRSAYDRIVDVSGKHVYPGLIAACTNLGLREIGAVRATNDQREVGRINPNIRSAIAYNTDSRIIPTVRSNGVLYGQITPSGNLISGSSSIMSLDAWNWEDAIVQADDAVHINWPRKMRRTGWWAEPGPFEGNDKYQEEIDMLYDFFNEAKAYKAGTVPANLKLEAMQRVFDGSKKVFIRVITAREIVAALQFINDFGIAGVLLDARECYKVIDLVAESDVPIILDRTHRLPTYRHSDIDEQYRNPAVLHEAGILFGISIGEAGDGYYNNRNLPFQAGQAVAYGLDSEIAVAAVSGNLAKIMGVDNQIGFIREGNDASLIVSDGDLLDMRTSNVVMAWIEGREVDLDNKQKQLSRKFATKLGQE